MSERRTRYGSAISSSSPAIRRPVLRGEEAAFGLNAECLECSKSAFLIRAEDRGGGVWYELAHDRLIGPVLHSATRAYRLTQ